MLNEKTIGFIQQVLEMDNDVTETEKEQVLKACRMKSARKTIPAKAAMEILQISRPTLREYVKRGLLEQINISSRKVRFDLLEVEQLANGEVKR